VETYDLIIIGGGPAGLTAGIYARRSRLNTLLIEKLTPGGQVLITDWVDNYPGFPEGISGFDLVDRIRRQAERFDLPVVSDEILSLSLDGPHKIIKGHQAAYRSRAVIIASGATHKRLGVQGEDLLTGKGVSYCATCDGPFYQGQDIVVVGGGDTAVQEALYLTRFAKKVYLIHRRDQLRAAKILQEKALSHPAIEPVWEALVEEIFGQGQVEGVKIKKLDGTPGITLTVQGAFVFIGIRPNTEWLKGALPLNDHGFIQTDDNMATTLPGVFAAGDVRCKLLWQISTAVGDGATAAFAAERYLESL
jgi:thioredoxin reductase (NADPH)